MGPAVVVLGTMWLILDASATQTRYPVALAPLTLPMLCDVRDVATLSHPPYPP